MLIPEKLLECLCGIPGYHRDDFLKVHQSGPQYRSIRINPHKASKLSFKPEQPVPWAQNGFYVPAEYRFTTDPLFHCGAYYVQEASSMFIEYILLKLSLNEPELYALDLCAAPGGKTSILMDVLNKNSLIWANEPNASRCLTLCDTLSRWGNLNHLVSRSSTRLLKEKCPLRFKLTLVDAPCSGSGLFRKQPEHAKQWHYGLVKEAVKTQQDILSDAYYLTDNEGYIIYSTCSFSPEENESITQWFMEHFNVKAISFNLPEEWSIYSSGCGYRFWPQHLKGEGFFCAVFQKKANNANPFKASIKPVLIKYKDTSKLNFKIYSTGPEPQIIERENVLYACSNGLIDIIKSIDRQILINKIGVRLGLVNQAEKPHHDCALTHAFYTSFPDYSVDLNTALRYLKGESLPSDKNAKGWHRISFWGLGLGWANFLNNRANNYYPKALKIIHL